jgi:hypothetical protein
MNTWIKKIHMYTGLLNFTILCVFGLAGLVVTAEAPDIFKAGTVPSSLPCLSARRVRLPTNR